MAAVSIYSVTFTFLTETFAPFVIKPDFDVGRGGENLLKKK